MRSSTNTVCAYLIILAIKFYAEDKFHPNKSIFRIKIRGKNDDFNNSEKKEFATQTTKQSFPENLQFRRYYCRNV